MNWKRVLWSSSPNARWAYIGGDARGPAYDDRWLIHRERGRAGIGGWVWALHAKAGPVWDSVTTTATLHDAKYIAEHGTRPDGMGVG